MDQTVKCFFFLYVFLYYNNHILTRAKYVELVLVVLCPSVAAKTSECFCFHVEEWFFRRHTDGKWLRCKNMYRKWKNTQRHCRQTHLSFQIKTVQQAAVGKDGEKKTVKHGKCSWSISSVKFTLTVSVCPKVGQ